MGLRLEGHTWTRGRCGDGAVIDDSSTLWGLALHQDECLFRALMWSAVCKDPRRKTHQDCGHDIGLEYGPELCHVIVLNRCVA